MAIQFTERFFNTAGPVRSDWHYLIDPLTRWDMDDILRLLAQGKYFVLHAPRQTGKTYPIYQEIIPRELTWTSQYTIQHETNWYVKDDRQLDMPKLLRTFQQFFRENSEA